MFFQSTIHFDETKKMKHVKTIGIRPNNRIWIAAWVVGFLLLSLLSLRGGVVSAVALEQSARCGMTEHTHDSACYNAGRLTCVQPQHTHTENCYLVLLRDNNINTLLAQVDADSSNNLEAVISHTVDTATQLSTDTASTTEQTDNIPDVQAVLLNNTTQPEPSEPSEPSETPGQLDVSALNESITENNIEPGLVLNENLYKASTLAAGPSDLTLPVYTMTGSSAAPETTQQDLPDHSEGPTSLAASGQTPTELQQNSLQDPREIVDLLSYLEAKGGSYFFTLLDKDNHELPKDADGNYIATADTAYKLTITINSPDGFLPGIYQHQIPNGLMMNSGEGSITLKGGTVLGTWEVTDTGLITLHFNDQIDSHAGVTLSISMGIRFPLQDEPLDFDGKITVTVEKPPPQTNPTILQKWGQPNADTGKLDWVVLIQGHADSQIPESVLTDQITLPDWVKPHSYNPSDIAAGLSFGVSDPNNGWHHWTVRADDPHLIWDEDGWSYKIPKTVVCDYCGELELGSNGWSYQINYSSTPTPLNTPGNFAYENKVTVDSQTAWGWNYFVFGQIEAQIKKDGAFISNAAGGGFLWTVQASVPGRPEGQRAEYSWAISDEMRLLDQNGSVIQRLPNDIHLATVTAFYNGVTVRIPRIQDATDQDMFAWDNAWTSEVIPATRTINLLCRCQCTPESCHWGSCGEYWYKDDRGVTVGTRDFCQCWTESQNMTFTLTYQTNDLSMVEAYGALGYKVNNHAQLYYIGQDDAPVQVDYDDASVEIPNLFHKTLTHAFNGYTANYKITVNEAKLVLTNGSPLYIRDTMSDTLTYISGSLVITAEDINGNVTTLKQDADYTVAYDGTGNQTDGAGNKAHILDITILHPLPVMYTLDYDATLIYPEHVTGAIKYSNSAEITLWGKNIKDTAPEKVYADINISTKSYRVEMYKTSALTGAPLADATFGFYNEQGGLITTETSDANGKLVFQTSIVEGIILREHTRYYLQELKAPPGYQLDDTKHWICFCDKKDGSCETCNEILAGLHAIRMPFEQVGKVKVTNQLMRYALPVTGGPGISSLILWGVIFIITPLMYGFIRRRKQEKGESSA